MSIVQTDIQHQVAPALPVIAVVDREITGAERQGSIYWVPENHVMSIRARLKNIILLPTGEEQEIPFPNSVMMCPVPEVVGQEIKKPLYFKANIVNTPGSVSPIPTDVWLEMDLKLPTGNYLLSPTFINASLAVAGHRFCLDFDPVDIVSYVVTQ